MALDPETLEVVMSQATKILKKKKKRNNLIIFISILVVFIFLIMEYVIVSFRRLKKSQCMYIWLCHQKRKNLLLKIIFAI